MKSHVITTRLDEEFEQLVNESKVTGMTQSRLVRDMVRKNLGFPPLDPAIQGHGRKVRPLKETVKND